MTLDQAYQELNRLLLIGAEQHPLSDELLQTLEEWQLPVEGTQTEVVLTALAAVRLMRRAGYPISAQRRWEKNEAPTENKEVCSRKSVYHLELILDGDFSAALDEFTDLLQEQDLLLPPAFLTALLDRCQLEPALYHQICPLLGERGKWLQRQNPAWLALDMPVEEVTHWANMSLEEKHRLLSSWRLADAAAARRFLAEQWPAAPKKEQEKLLPLLQVGLAAADETWLNERLLAKRKKIRETAADLLSRIPESALSHRLFQRAAEVWRWGSTPMQLHLPDELPAVSAADGIPTKTHRAYGGLKMSWLGYHIERIPPHRWTHHFGKTARQIVAAVGRSREAKALLYALTGAALRFREKEWMSVLLEHFLSGERADDVVWDRVQELFRQVSAEQIHAVPRSLLQFGREGGWRQLPAVQLLLLNPHRWSADMSLHVLQQMQQAIARRTNPPDLRPLFEGAAYRADPAILRQAKTGWPTLEGDGGYFPWALQKFLRTLTFRREMRAGIQKE